jgi:hypothetical protein
LKFREAPRTSTAAGRVAFDDEDFRASGVIGVAAQKLSRERSVDQFTILFAACSAIMIAALH